CFLANPVTGYLSNQTIMNGVCNNQVLAWCGEIAVLNPCSDAFDETPNTLQRAVGFVVRSVQFLPAVTRLKPVGIRIKISQQPIAQVNLFSCEFNFLHNALSITRRFS